MASLELYNFTKAKVLSALAGLAYENKIDENTPNEIAKQLFPNLKDGVRRCCVYKEREIAREQTLVGLNRKPDGSVRLTDQLVYVMEAACDGCDIHKVRITDSCRKCLARSCERACRFDAIYLGQSKMHINYEKCRGCGMCVKACSYSAIMQSERPCRKACPTGALKHINNEIAYIEEKECINCGQCVASCPFGAISDVSFMPQVIKHIVDKDKEVIALVAPAVQGQFGIAKLPQIIESFKDLGFDETLEVGLAADLVTISEANEAKKVVENGGKITTSCCPAFVELMKMKYKDVYDKYTSTTVSPMVAMGRVMRKLKPNAILVFVGPCIAKKHEIMLEKNQGGIDYVLTFEEILAMMKAKNVDPINYKGDIVSKHGSSAGRSYCYTGGVATSLKTYLKEIGTDDSALVLKTANGSFECNDCLKALQVGKLDANVLEGMMCLGGCTGGVASLATNPIVTKLNNNRENAAIAQTKIGEVMSTLGIDSVDMEYDKSKN